MSIRVTIRNTTTNTTLATQDIPETAVTAIQRAFPAATPALSAELALAFMLDALRHKVRAVRLAIKQQETQDAATLAVSAELTDFETNEWP